LKRAASEPSCAVVTVRRDSSAEQLFQLRLEHSLKNSSSRFLTLGGKTALDTVFDEFWGGGEGFPVLRRDFFARHAASWCDQQSHNNDTRVAHRIDWSPSCSDDVPFLLNIKAVDPHVDPHRTLHIIWPSFLVLACYGLILFGNGEISYQ
tara:strand:- start:680 stop:1129 length:450 start_codon:yes stop_codon:yes gene_type:complete